MPRRSPVVAQAIPSLGSEPQLATRAGSSVALVRPEGSPDRPANPPGGFPSTHWTTIIAAGKRETDAGLKALGKFLSRYEPALTSYLRRKFFYNEDEAKDLFHDFILQNVLRKELLAQARPMKGYQFRKFLLCAIHTFAVSEYRRRTALKRKPAQGLSSLEDLTETEFTSTDPTQSEEFDVAWARNVLTEALRRMHAECKATSRMDVWGVFENRLLGPMLEGRESQPYDQLVRQFGLKSPAQAHNVLVTAKRTFTRCLQQAVGEYAPDENAVQLEIRELQIILSHAR